MYVTHDNVKMYAIRYHGSTTPRCATQYTHTHDYTHKHSFI